MAKTTTDHAADLRAALKARGWTSRKVSVRADYYSMGSSIDVVIKDPDIPVAVVKALAVDHERIHRCEVTGEILGGGNRYVSIRLSREAEAALAARYLGAVEAALARVTDPNLLIPVEGTPFLVGKPDWAVSLWEDSFLCRATDARTLAVEVGCRMVNKQYDAEISRETEGFGTEDLLHA